jgi:predicted nuclease of predicted toxin-antitoxin system
MRLLADENFPLPTLEELRRDGHDVLWVRTHAPGAKDAALLDQAETDSRIVLTLDRDFWQIALQRRAPIVESGVILFRVHPAIPAILTPAVRRAFDTDRQWAGHVSIVTLDEIRMIPVRVPTTRDSDSPGCPPPAK